MTRTIVGVKYRNDQGNFSGRAYTYFCELPVAVGDIVSAPTSRGTSAAVIAEVDIPENRVDKSILSKLKTITEFAEVISQSEDLPLFKVDPAPASDNHQTALSVIDQDSDHLIIIKTMPVIEQQLEALKPEIEKLVADALAMECTKENIQKVKKTRAGLNKISEALNKRRIQIKTLYMAPYDAMLQTFKNCVTDPLSKADRELGRRTDELEDADKKKTEDGIKAYFTEYAASVGYPDMPYERANINVTLSATAVSLKNQARTFIDRVSSELGIIAGLEYADEITVEYNKSLMLKFAIDTVKERHRLIDEANKRREEAAAAEAQRKEAAEKATETMAEFGRVANAFAPVAETKVTAELAPDIDSTLFAGFGQPQQATQPAPLPKGMVTAIITITDTPQRIQALEQTLSFGGYEYGITYSDNR